MRRIFKLLVIVVLIGSLAVLLVATLVFNVWDRDYPGGTPADHGQQTKVGALTLPLPEGWKVSSANGVAYAEPPGLDCGQVNTCKTIAVHDSRTYLSGNEQALTAYYNCPTNASESPGPLTPRGAVEIGPQKLGALKYTLEQCGVSGGQVLSIYTLPLPPIAIVVKTSGEGALPKIDSLLKEASIG